MSKLIAKCGSLLAVGVFAVALMFGTQQAFAATGTSWCDTPDNVCADDDDCDVACWIYADTNNGGG